MGAIRSSGSDEHPILLRAIRSSGSDEHRILLRAIRSSGSEEHPILLLLHCHTPINIVASETCCLRDLSGTGRNSITFAPYVTINILSCC